MKSEISSVLVLKPSSLGDIVHTLPVVALIKRRWPAARVRWLINSEWAPLLDGNPHVDEIVLFPRREFRGWRGLFRIAPWARELRGRIQADLVLDFQGLLRSALIAKLCCAKTGRIVGLSDAREGARFFYDRAVPVTGLAHAVDRYLALVADLGLDIVTPLECPLPQGSPPAGFAETGPFVVLHPFSRGAGKSLSAADVATFCRELAPLRVVIAGRSEEAAPALENVRDLLNRTALPELIWLLRRAAFVVSVDSGPMHIAAALPPPLLAIHTWSDPRKVGPYRPDAWVWKDGALCRMQDFAPAKNTHPAPDITAIAQHVRALLSG